MNFLYYKYNKNLNLENHLSALLNLKSNKKKLIDKLNKLKFLDEFILNINEIEYNDLIITQAKFKNINFDNQEVFKISDLKKEIKKINLSKTNEFKIYNFFYRYLKINSSNKEILKINILNLISMKKLINTISIITLIDFLNIDCIFGEKYMKKNILYKNNFKNIFLETLIEEYSDDFDFNVDRIGYGIKNDIEKVYKVYFGTKNKEFDYLSEMCIQKESNLNNCNDYINESEDKNE
ncbi:MAG: hypothetical protein ACQEQE_04225 [Bacillota bacterium]